MTKVLCNNNTFVSFKKVKLMIELIKNYWVETFLTFLTTGIIYIIHQYVGLKNGILSLLRNEIVRIYETYSSIGMCPSYMKENLNEIYSSYHKLGGNGLATAMVDELYKLPNQKRKI